MTTVITGGSRGIGRAAVEAFAARGDRVYFLYEKDHQAARETEQATGATAVCCDVADGEQVEAAFARIPDVDILVNNAGISVAGLFQTIPGQTWDRLFDVNVKGMFHCIRGAMPYFLKKQSGCIINVSSMWGITGGSYEAAYSATKGAVIAMSKALAKELGPSGIRVNCVAPGVILTDMCANVDSSILQRLAEETPIGRNGRPEDVAKAMVFLSEADFITGHVLSVDGGYVI